MAQNKKKKKRHQQTNGRNGGNYNLMYKPDKDKSLSVDYILAQTIPFEQLPFRLPSCAPDSGIAPLILKRDYPKQKLDEKDIDEYLGTLETIKNQLKAQLNHWLSCCKDAQKALNIYNEEAVKEVTIDTIDFSEYVQSEDLTLNAFLAIQRNPDIAMLWSTRDFVDIKISDAVFYRVYRIMYDHVNIGIRYCIYEYINFEIAKNNIVCVPVNQFVLQADVVCVENNEYAYNDAHPKKIPLNEPAKQNADIFSKYVDNPNMYHAVRLGIMGRNGLGSCLKHLMNNHSHMPKPQYRANMAYIISIGQQLYGNNREESYIMSNHFETAVAVAISAIIVANDYLRQKKLSKSHAYDTKHEIDITLMNKPERKTRILGQNIFITSDERPQPPSMDRIVHYHTPEWTRKSHLRHLKSGKVVEIPAGRCKRKCVDMSGISSKLPEQATDYIVKPNKIIEE